MARSGKTQIVARADMLGVDGQSLLARGDRFLDTSEVKQDEARPCMASALAASISTTL
jgi:hypothetical protein